MIEKLGSLSTQALIDGLWVMGWPGAHIEGARSLAPGQKCAGRAVTLVTQYDVELLLAIEEHQGAKLQTLELDEPPVLALLPVVAAAGRAS